MTVRLLYLAPYNPAMPELVPLYEASRQRAFEDAESTAKAVARCIAA
jgi:FMN-dependent NADH-azoreductase